MQEKVTIGIRVEKGANCTGSNAYSIVAVVDGVVRGEYVLQPYYRANETWGREELAVNLYREAKELPVFCKAKRQLKKAIEAYLDLIDEEAKTSTSSKTTFSGKHK